MEREEMTTEELDSENTERLRGLMQGSAGVPVQLAPHTFDMVRFRVYLETLLFYSEGLPVLEIAKDRYAREAAEMLDNLEQAARQAKLMNPGMPMNGERP